MDAPPPYDDLPAYEDVFPETYKPPNTPSNVSPNNTPASTHSSYPNQGTTTQPPSQSTSRVQHSQVTKQTPPRKLHCGIMNSVHIISIICAICSLILPPIELIPMAIFCVYREELSRRIGRHCCIECFYMTDVVVTFIVTLILLIFICLITVFTFGLGIILFVFIIPHIIVLAILFDPVR